MKKLIFSIIFILLLTISCAKKDLTVFESETDNSATEQRDYNAFTFAITGELISSPNHVAYDKADPESWISILFNSDMSGGTVDITVIKAKSFDESHSYNFEWTYGNTKSQLIMKPLLDLQKEETYVLKIKGSGTKDRYGNYYDFDGDGIGGEPIDDDYYRIFTTRKENGNDGTPKPFTQDLLNPYYASNIFCMHPTDTTTISWVNFWYDGRVGIFVRDEKYDTLGGFLRSSLNPATVTTGNIKLFEKFSGNEVSGTVSYQQDTVATQWGRLLFDPSDTLVPGRTYVIRFYGDALKDSAGNKLNKLAPGIDEFEFTPLNLASNGDTLTGDYVPPTVTQWGNASNATVIFSELINDATVGPATIYLTSGDFLNYDIKQYFTGSIFVTIVYIKRVEGGSLSGKTLKVRGIKDKAGNLMSGEESHTY